jgi:DNA (cytosine-5)-methyltransferase 1
MPFHYYNEFDPYAAQWLRNLIGAGHICDGHVDERSISEVHPVDLLGFDQCHFFAGIGGWSLALRLAGWPDDREIWTGSCPCQPFSAAGKRGGFDDERHLWPVFSDLIRQCRPAVVMGEQVASKDGLVWLNSVFADLEGSGYLADAVDLCAAGVGAPHIRQRLWWVGAVRPATAAGEPGGLADAERIGRERGRPSEAGVAGREEAFPAVAGPREACGAGRPGPTNSLWRDADWLFCRDGKWRPVEPGTFPLAHGVSGRVGRLRAYGNAIVPQVAAEVIAAFMECRP